VPDVSCGELLDLGLASGLPAIRRKPGLWRRSAGRHGRYPVLWPEDLVLAGLGDLQVSLTCCVWPTTARS
jgi:hypothetical protein